MRTKWLGKYSRKALRARIASLETTLNDIRLQLNAHDANFTEIYNMLEKEPTEDERFSNNPGEE